MKITEILMAEHAVFHNLFDHIEATAPGLETLAEVRSLAVLIEKVLEPHARTEDELFIGPLEHCFEQLGQSETFHQEHDLIEDCLARAGSVQDLETARDYLLRAIDASRKHFDKEERIVFPLAERVLKAQTLANLGNEWLKRREAVMA